MSTRLAPQRNFMITRQSSSSSASTSTPTPTSAKVSTANDSSVSCHAASASAVALLATDCHSSDTDNFLVEATAQTTTTTATTSGTAAASEDSSPPFEFIASESVVSSGELVEHVMTQNDMSNGVDDCPGAAAAAAAASVDHHGGVAEGVAVINVVTMPLPDGSNSSSDDLQGGGVGVGFTATSLSAIKGVDLAQQVANGQLTVVRAQTDHRGEVEDITPQYITVTVSAQDAPQNYQVQYVDTELYHSNSSQTQMAYPFCPVGDYQTNGQAYYSTAAAAAATSNYPTAGNTPTTHATALPYLVPVEETLLLNSSSQSHHSRDSPHSLTEVSYIQEAHSTPQTPTSSSTTNSASGMGLSGGGGGPNGGGGTPSPSDEHGPMGNTNKIASATIKWLSRNYETADGVSLPRSTLYNHYIHHCNEHKLEPVNAASFGKLIRSVFSGLRTRRLGTRGNSKYHYYGIRIKPGSLLNQSAATMDEKTAYSTGQTTATAGGSSSGAVTSAVGGGHASGSSSASTGGNNGGGGGHHSHGKSSSRKHLFKPESFEMCAQYLGDGAGAIPTFPHIELDHSFHSDLTQDDVETFRAIYREHCESFLDAILNLEFNSIEFLWRDFWLAPDNNNLDDCDEEKFLSKTKLYLLCQCAEVQKFVKEVDYQFYQNMVDVIIPDVLRSIPNTLTQAIRNFAKNLELWMCESMVGVPERFVQIKSAAVSAFCQTLRRYTSLNHLAQAARAVLQNGSQIAQMLNDLNRVDFHNVQEQAAWVCQCDPGMVQRLENDFKAALQQQSSLEQWASWLQLVVDSALQEYRGKPSYAKAARQFLLKWSFYSSMVIRDLTLRSASSFGSFHLIRLLYDEYMFYLVEHKIAEAQQKTAIAVICDRVQKDMEYDFDYQLEQFINDGSEPPSSHSAKRLKQE